MPLAEQVITSVRVSFPRINRKDAVNATIEWLGTMPVDVQGAILGQLPESRRPDFAKLILQEMTNQKPGLKLAAKKPPTPKGKR